MNAITLTGVFTEGRLKMPVSGDVSRHRAQVARRSQSYPANHPRVVEAKRDLIEANARRYIKTVLAQRPPLTDEQRTRLAELLRPVRKGGAR
ncbi:hypothetical protein [Mycolicibacter kumamotonensis]|uniref:hypothetical protein n=1 Tax=Mycolicibacter kumamotonensis TaxID=354243 RepID=UPI00138986BB